MLGLFGVHLSKRRAEKQFVPLKLLLRCLHNMMPGHVKFALAYSEYLSKEMSTF